MEGHVVSKSESTAGISDMRSVFNFIARSRPAIVSGARTALPPPPLWYSVAVVSVFTVLLCYVRPHPGLPSSLQHTTPTLLYSHHAGTWDTTKLTSQYTMTAGRGCPPHWHLQFSSPLPAPRSVRYSSSVLQYSITDPVL